MADADEIEEIKKLKAMFALRFDFRNPSFAGVDMADRYRAALDMAEWADRHGEDPEAAWPELGPYFMHEVNVLHPMVGGIPPERAWEHPRLFERTFLSPGGAR